MCSPTASSKTNEMLQTLVGASASACTMRRALKSGDELGPAHARLQTCNDQSPIWIFGQNTRQPADHAGDHDRVAPASLKGEEGAAAGRLPLVHVMPRVSGQAWVIDLHVLLRQRHGCMACGCCSCAQASGCRAFACDIQHVLPHSTNIDHASRAAHLAHKRVTSQELGQLSARGGLTLHAQSHGGQASQEQPAVKGPQDGALCVLGTQSLSAVELATCIIAYCCMRRAAWTHHTVTVSVQGAVASSHQQQRHAVTRLNSQVQLYRAAPVQRQHARPGLDP